MLKKISRLKKNNRSKRLRKVILAEWQQINKDNYIEELTDAMTYNYPVQINYEGSGWRTINPYGWNTSQQNEDGTGANILLMCYKDTGEVRSYRMDKILELYIDKESMVFINNNVEMNNDNDLDGLINMQTNQKQDVDITLNDYPDDMPELPEMNDLNVEPDGVYDQELEMLSNDINDQNYEINEVNEPNEINEEDNQSNMDYNINNEQNADVEDENDKNNV